MLLEFSLRCIRQGFVHPTYVVGNDLGQHCGALLFAAVFEHLFLGRGKRNADAGQGCSLSLHHLAHQIADLHGVLVGGIQPFLLGKQVVHGRDQRFETILARDERCELLRSRQLHLVTDDAQRLLGRCQAFNAVDLFIGRLDPLAHDRRQLYFGSRLNVPCVLRIVDIISDFVNGPSKPH